MKNAFINLFFGISILFAFCSSVYCLSLILDYFMESDANFLGISFYICIFIAGILINLYKGEDNNGRN